MSFVETGGYGDVATHGGTHKILDSEDRWTGALDNGWDFNPFNDHAMPRATQDSDTASVAGDVPNAQQYRGRPEWVGERYGQTVQWQSSCQLYFESYLTQAKGLIDTLGVAATASPGSPKHVGPCTFGELYVDAVGYINKIVGSWDPVNGIAFASQGDKGYVARNHSWIFGGSKSRTQWPSFSNNPVGSSFTVGKWWTQQEYAERNPNWRQAVSNGEFCRSMMVPDYPCMNATAYPDQCGEDGGFWGNSDQAFHYPLSYWQREFSSLRITAMGYVSQYELKNKALLNGKTVDQTCEQEVAEQVVAAPDVSLDTTDQEEQVYQAEVAAEAQEAAVQAEQQALLMALSGDVQQGAGINPLLLVGGVASLGLIYFLQRRRKG